jgi:hypothetical protein
MGNDWTSESEGSALPVFGALLGQAAPNDRAIKKGIHLDCLPYRLEE